MNADHSDILSVISIIASAAAAFLSLRKHDAKKHEAKLTARRELGLSYARSAWAVVLHRQTAPGARQAALLDAFRLADTALDGKRDFSDAQAATLLDEVAKEFQS